mgnify:CR=1 FL=1
MNEEEKKAVEILNTFEFRRKTRNYKIISLEDSKSVKIVLNLLEKLKNEELKNDMSNMYNEEVVISIMCDELNLSRSEALKILGGE